MRFSLFNRPLAPVASTVEIDTTSKLSAVILSYLPRTETQLLSVHRTWRTFITDKMDLELASYGFLRYILPHCRDLFASIPPSQFLFSILSGGLTNFTFKLNIIGQTMAFVVRFAGTNSATFINRSAEQVQAGIASELSVNTRIFYFDAVTGNQISEFINNAIPLSAETLQDKLNIQLASDLMKMIHQSPKSFLLNEDAFQRNRKFTRLITEKKPLPPAYKAMSSVIDSIEAIVARIPIHKTPCHNDTTPGNFLMSTVNGRTKANMIDFEYAGQNDPLWDLANFAAEAGFRTAQDLALLKHYYSTQEINPAILHRYTLYKLVVEYYVVIWCQLQLVNQNYKNKPHYVDLIALREKRFDNFTQMLFCQEYLRAIQFFQDYPFEVRGSSVLTARLGFLAQPSSTVIEQLEISESRRPKQG
jgi:thiamine kinase-like enzyme